MLHHYLDLNTINTVLNILAVVLLIFLCILTVYKMTLNNARNKEYICTIQRMEKFIENQADIHNREFHDLGEILNRYLDYIARNSEAINRVTKIVDKTEITN